MLAMPVFAMRQLKASTKFGQLLEGRILSSSLHSAAGSPGGQMESAEAEGHQGQRNKQHVKQSIPKKPQERHHVPAKSQQQQPSDTWVLHWEDITGAS